MNKFIKIFSLILIVSIICLITSCGNSNLKAKQIELFDSVSPELTNTIQFKNDLINSELHNDEYIDAAIKCYSSQSLYNKYRIGVFTVESSDIDVFIWYDGNIFKINSLGINLNRTIDFINFAVADINKDSFNEFYVAYSYGYTDENNESYLYSYVYTLDLASQKVVSSLPNYDNYLFFINDNNHLYVGESKSKNLDGDFKIFFEVRANEKKFEILKDNFTVTTNTFTANIYIENDYVDFPVFLDDFCKLKFKVRAEMTYLGESFSYTNGNSYLEGATVEFCCGENSIEQEGILAVDVITNFDVVTNQIIDRNYIFYDSYKTFITAGTYDAVVSYRGVNVTMEDVLRFY